MTDIIFNSIFGSNKKTKAALCKREPGQMEAVTLGFWTCGREWLVKPCQSCLKPSPLIPQPPWRSGDSPPVSHWRDLCAGRMVLSADCHSSLFGAVLPHWNMQPNSTPPPTTAVCCQNPWLRSFKLRPVLLLIPQLLSCSQTAA